ncbi:hypothetical protein AB0K05_21065 [Nonomuraea sp. NPDC049486]|uniref:DUF3127 domain-containing protein n=1 Tax=Nonomuraea harbinensis TaxID=1286938 RepID=A0ABW1BV02_9ACTN|nr:hypothetical protein [Nonomuraea harbinensis]
MRFPIDAGRLAFTVTAPPNAAKDFTTKKAKVTDDGQPIMVVTLLAMDGADSAKIKFNLPGEQSHLVPGLPVRVEGLCFNTAKEGEVRWWSAAAVTGVHASAAANAAPSRPASMAGEGAAGGTRRTPHASAPSASASSASARHGGSPMATGGESTS